MLKSNRAGDERLEHAARERGPFHAGQRADAFEQPAVEAPEVRGGRRADCGTLSVIDMTPSVRYPRSKP
jgi:hypothetical protein